MNATPPPRTPSGEPAVPPGNAPDAPQGAPVLLSADLFAGAREVLIRHNGETYRLQETRAGKLILVK
jgi:hemin uptake protein HemP